MMIACLGWGSLIWKPESLPLASEWFLDGPLLPIEFSRVGDGGELATAICPDAPPVKVLWSVLAVESLEQACEALRQREQIPADRQGGIGLFKAGRSPVGTMARWAAQRQLDAVVWTALEPRFEDNEGRVPSLDDVLAYLSGLTGETLAHVRDYIRQVPRQIDTPYRREIASRLGCK